MVNRLGSISISSHFWASLSCHAWTTILPPDPGSSFLAAAWLVAERVARAKAILLENPTYGLGKRPTR